MRTHGSPSPHLSSRRRSASSLTTSRHVCAIIFHLLHLHAWKGSCTAALHETMAAAQKNFGKPVEWGLVKDYAWSTPQLRKLDTPVRLCAAH